MLNDNEDEEDKPVVIRRKEHSATQIIGTALVLGFYTPLAGIGVWIGLATGLTVAAALLGWRWHRREALGLTRHPLNA